MEPHIRRGVPHAGLGKVIALMEDHPDEPVTGGRLSAAARLSLRQLERRFRQHFQTTPLRYYLELRLQRARGLLQYTDLPIVEVAVSSGFGSAAHFSLNHLSWAGNEPNREHVREQP